jgi:hypothetical protein
MLKHNKLYLSALAMSLILVVAAEVRGASPTITWGKDLEEVTKEAKASGKQILIDFFVPT